MVDICQDDTIIENFIHQWQTMFKITKFNFDHAVKNIS